MENSSNSESNLLHPKLSREEAIRRINASTEAMLKAGTSWVEVKSWANSNFSRLPKELRDWEIPNQEILALLDELSTEDRKRFHQCLSFYEGFCKDGIGSCDCLDTLLFLAGVVDRTVCMRLYRKFTGACSATYGFQDWDEVLIKDVFFPRLRKARAEKALSWLRAWNYAQLINKETTQGDK